MKQKKLFKTLGLFLCTLFILLFTIVIGQAMDLPKMIDKTNCTQYKDMLVPPMYRAVERGDFVITPGAVSFNYKYTDSFLAAGAKNEGKFDISNNGELIDKKTGKYPENVHSWPFPKIDAKDPKAGSKIISNFNFSRWRFMASFDHVRIMWINKSGEERYIDGMDGRLYMNGRPPGTAIKNPDKVETYEFENVMEL